MISSKSPKKPISYSLINPILQRRKLMHRRKISCHSQGQNHDILLTGFTITDSARSSMGHHNKSTGKLLYFQGFLSFEFHRENFQA